MSAITGTWAWQDLDEALSSDGKPVPVRIAVSNGRPVLVFPGQRPVKGRWAPGARRLTVTAVRPLTAPAGAVASVRYVLKVTGPPARLRMAGTLVVRHKDYPGISAVAATRTARPV